ncbi:hypothetical protein GCM10011514_41020 [Emticicia aquatilis]|uniref:Uncharacterized protein n=1 Tax=Emticicia aquatilis TaxID=1537369 RepID=A0A916Z2B9_9BACT|nr:hypothetical protein [Emticicia aquatilis]GGD72713.1 hypothetical protein GCM10011514_41020 [Emticicia aquatilis]
MRKLELFKAETFFICDVERDTDRQDGKDFVVIAQIACRSPKLSAKK